MSNKIENLSVKLFADGADIDTMKEMSSKPFIKGLTTNPTLMRKSGVHNYRNFAAEVLQVVSNKPISFEVFSDDFEEMKRQALEIASWGSNVNVKIPITNSKGEMTTEIIRELSHEGVKLNVTAIMTTDQVKSVVEATNSDVPVFISVFAGRIADTGRDPIPVMQEALSIMQSQPKSELIWASPRELLNVFQADQIGCHVITATSDILKKLEIVGKDLAEYSLETVRMFRDDALASGYSI